MIDAIIAAAGSSERFGEDKLFLGILGKPVVFYSIDSFENSSVNRIIITSRKDKIPYLQRVSSSWKDTYNWKKEIMLCEGGGTRAESVFNALKMSSGNIVSIHDGARPLVTPELINHSIDDCIKYGSSVVVKKPNDAVKMRVRGNIENIDRNSVYLAETPQTFPRDKLIHAYERFFSENPNASPADDCEVFSKYYPVHFTENSQINLKLTIPSDLDGILKLIEKYDARI
ncbi:MAG: IspD/TarI family cytidylyltransferase [Candidatus Woesearchaeota archaeon]|nr:IspD/TarI family cytidylyltransferase [Candidatus Woesearchaeota archaeon]